MKMKQYIIPGRKIPVRIITALCIVILHLASAYDIQAQTETVAFEISMENPNSHYYHVNMIYSGASSPIVNFKIPSWTPGYYIILDYAKNITRFQAADNEGNTLKWNKITKNTWQVETNGSGIIEIDYDVYAFRVSVGEPFLDDGRAFIAPAGIFMYIEDKLNLPATVTINPYKDFSAISTGLDPVKGRMNTFHAPDFDILYDCPILTGNQEILTFEVEGIEHTIAIENPGPFDREKVVDDHRKMVLSAVSIIGEIPYSHYTFLIMNRGMGGLEHLNSMAVYTNTSTFGQSLGYDRWLSFVAHEFFHLYNVKRIRPIELGPFDYDKENYTKMLWVSEGFTVYYEYLVLNRAGLMNRNNVLRELGAVIRNYENIPGHLFQSVEESSFDTWIQFFNRSENTSNTTISYYDKGCALGMLLDLKIRHESDNTKSLDDVMRTLYNVYYKEKERGFTREEFRDVCEEIAGCSLSEIFDVYAATTEKVDYNKYLNYAGLEIDMEPVRSSGVWFGIRTREDDKRLVITGVEWDSPAYKAGLSAQDVILEIDGVAATAEILNNLRNNGQAGDNVVFKVSHREKMNTVDVIAGMKTTRSFEIRQLPDISGKQKAILDNWLK